MTDLFVTSNINIIHLNSKSDTQVQLTHSHILAHRHRKQPERSPRQPQWSFTYVWKGRTWSPWRRCWRWTRQWRQQNWSCALPCSGRKQPVYCGITDKKQNKKQISLASKPSQSSLAPARANKNEKNPNGHLQLSLNCLIMLLIFSKRWASRCSLHW